MSKDSGKGHEQEIEKYKLSKEPFYVPVHSRYSLEPGGPTLGEVAEQHGIW